MEILEKAKSHLGTYKAVADYLGVSISHISHVKHGRERLRPVQIARLAELVGERWSDHVLPAMAAIESDPVDKAFWLGKAAALRSVAAAVVLGLAAMIGILTEPEPAFS